MSAHAIELRYYLRKVREGAAIAADAVCTCGQIVEFGPNDPVPVVRGCPVHRRQNLDANLIEYCEPVLQWRYMWEDQHTFAHWSAWEDVPYVREK